MMSALFVSLSAKGIERTELKSIVETYEEAFENRSYGKLRGIFHSLDNCDKNALFSYDVRSVKINDIDGNNISVTIRYKYLGGGSSHETSGWIQLTNEGKIKYDPLLVKHPIPTAFFAVRMLIIETESVLLKTGRYADQPLIPYRTQLLNTGVPEFDIGGLQLKQRLEKYKDILRWLIENGDTWDATDPKVPCSERQFKDLVRDNKKYL